MTVIRSAGLRGFRAAVAELGGDAEEYARAAGLPVAALDSDDLLVDDLAMTRVLELAAAGLDRPDLGLRVAARQDLGMLGALALAIQNSPTVADALECTSRYLFVHAQALSLTLEPDPYGTPGIAALRFGPPPGLPAPVQGTDLGLGFLHRAIRFLVDGPYGLRTVELPYRPAAPLAVYEEFFGVPVRVARPAALLRVPRSLGDRPLSGGDEHLRRLALAFLAEQAPDGHAGLVPRVRGAVQQSLGTAPPDIGTVARLLSVHPRTLQRRLRAEGTTYAAILDDVRRQAARHYLTGTALPMTQIAALLGLSEQSALTRCCRRWWGQPPRAVRRSGGTGAPEPS
ncbi:AraC family transcriptional regulator [Streptomyces sp. Ru73]|uniref:AraC family transcriptional regulator n=1 Tax=Streptomyces sp. Ru73 TaxID=2080748 RepID=UPI000CDD2B3A|nr:AraC family transcriptional regulator [Streptomyces sp. Ru73]POX40520.1 AraC family transcriptional regulator [Streptomyces sp. Ru73]